MWGKHIKQRQSCSLVVPMRKVLRTDILITYCIRDSEVPGMAYDMILSEGSPRLSITVHIIGHVIVLPKSEILGLRCKLTVYYLQDRQSCCVGSKGSGTSK